METENKDHIGKLESDLQKKEDEIHLLRKEIDNYTETVDSLEKHVTEINSKLEEKDQLVQELQDREKQLEAEREKVFSMDTFGSTNPSIANTMCLNDQCFAPCCRFRHLCLLLKASSPNLKSSMIRC